MNYSLGRRCEYGLISPPPSSASSEASLEQTPRVPPLKKGPRKLGIHEAITENLAKAVGELSDIRIVAARYFNTVHLWLPVISETLYYERLPSIFTNPLGDWSLLNLALALICTVPPDDTRTELYFLLKSSISLVEAADINSLEVVQARLLVCVYEVGHGMSAAYISIAATARAAVELGINERTGGICDEVEARLWWGIVMVDRYCLLPGPKTEADEKDSIPLRKEAVQPRHET